MSEEALQTAEKRREMKSKGERKDIPNWMQSSREYQGEIRRPSYVHFLCEQCKEIEENNIMGKTRDLFKKIRGNNGTIY